MKEIVFDLILRFLDLAWMVYSKALIAVVTTTIFMMLIFGYEFHLTIHFSSAAKLYEAIKKIF